MRITDLLSASRMRLHVAVADKQDALDQLIALIRQDGLLADPDAFRRAVLEREEQVSTAIQEGIALFDCRCKADGINGFARRWPNVAASSPETIARIDGRWEEYGLGPFIESPSLHYSRLQYGNGAAVCPEKHRPTEQSHVAATTPNHK